MRAREEEREEAASRILADARQREPEKKARALELFEEETGAGRASASTQVLQEFYVNVTRKLDNHLSPEREGAGVRDLGQLRLVRVDAPIILPAIARTQSQSFSFRDALILEAVISTGADRFFTEDL